MEKHIAVTSNNAGAWASHKAKQQVLAAERELAPEAWQQEAVL